MKTNTAFLLMMMLLNGCVVADKAVYGSQDAYNNIRDSYKKPKREVVVEKFSAKRRPVGNYISPQVAYQGNPGAYAPPRPQQFNVKKDYRYYVEGKLGYNTVSDLDREVQIAGVGFPAGNGDPEGSISYGGTIGAYVMPNVRVEAEVLQADSNIETGPATVFKIKTLTGSANGYYEFDNFAEEYRFIPFVGAGLGLTAFEFKAANTSADDTVPVYHLIAGVDFPLGERVATSVAYKYTGAFSDLDLTFALPGGLRKEKAKYSSHNFSAGMKYKF